jgi:hypothetical protein
MKSATSATVRAGDGILARVRVPRTASAHTSPRARADAAASLSRPRAGRLLDLRPLASLAGVGLLGSSPFTLVGDPASDSLLPIGELTLDDPAAEAPAGIGVLDSGPITSGIPGTSTGLTPGTSGGPGDPATTTFAPLRPSVSGVLPFTGAASDLLAPLVAGGLLVAGILIVRAARPATAATEGGEER